MNSIRAIALALVCVATAAASAQEVERIPFVEGRVEARSALEWDDTGYATRYREQGALAQPTWRVRDESAYSGRIRLRYNKPRGGGGEVGVHTGTVEFSCSSENPSNVRVSLAFEKAYGGETSSPDDGAILSWGRRGGWTLDHVYTLSGGTLTFNRAAVAVEFLKWFDTGYPTAKITATTIGMDSRGGTVLHKWFVRGSRETQRDARFVEALDIFKEAAGECVSRYEDHERTHG